MAFGYSVDDTLVLFGIHSRRIFIKPIMILQHGSKYFRWANWRNLFGSPLHTKHTVLDYSTPRFIAKMKKHLNGNRLQVIKEISPKDLMVFYAHLGWILNKL